MPVSTRHANTIRSAYYQGIGRFAPAAAYERGLADLKVLADLVPPRDYMFGPKPTSIDAGIYGFIANIYFYSIETPLKKFVTSQSNLVRHCTAIHRLVDSNPPTNSGNGPRTEGSA